MQRATHRRSAGADTLSVPSIIIAANDVFSKMLKSQKQEKVEKANKVQHPKQKKKKKRKKNRE